MMLKALAAGALITLPKPLQILANEKNAAGITETSGGGNPLRIPSLFTNGGNMNIQQTTFQVWPGQNTQINTINGNYLGPTVMIDKGQTFNANVQNNLSEVTTIHWHGLNVPELMDGHPKDAITVGGSRSYTFPVINRGGTYWYHAHPDMLTGKQVYRGVAGFFIVRDPAENFNLPSGSYDIPLCIQDRRTADIPNFPYSPGSYEQNWGMLGDTVLVNGTPDAYLDVSRTLYRFRILNGSNARVYKLAFSDNRNFHIIATDGGLKDAPVQLNQVTLSPGERVEILVDFSSNTIGQNVTLRSVAFSHGGVNPYKQGTALDVLRFEVVNNNTSGGTVPGAFNPITYYDDAGAFTRQFDLTMSGSHPMHRINGQGFEINRIDFEVPQHRIEKWTFRNLTADFHPMHTHEAQWQVFSRTSGSLQAWDRGWKDTVLLSPGETVSVLVKFTEHKGIFLIHCHNLEHEDEGMMSNFRIIDPIGIQQIGTEVPSQFRLQQNYPNPFNPTTKIRFDIDQKAAANNTKLSIFNIEGREVATLVNSNLKAGKYEADWNASGLSSGTYIARIVNGNMSRSLKLILSK